MIPVMVKVETYMLWAATSTERPLMSRVSPVPLGEPIIRSSSVPENWRSISSDHPSRRQLNVVSSPVARS